jgi:hypothetical protein
MTLVRVNAWFVDERKIWVPQVGVLADLRRSPAIPHRSRSTATCGTQFTCKLDAYAVRGSAE